MRPQTLPASKWRSPAAKRVEGVEIVQRTRVHLVGIGGIGMSGIAEVLLTSGHVVTGSDLHETDATRRLARLVRERRRTEVSG